MDLPFCNVFYRIYYTARYVQDFLQPPVIPKAVPLARVPVCPADGRLTPIVDAAARMVPGVGNRHFRLCDSKGPIRWGL